MEALKAGAIPTMTRRRANSAKAKEQPSFFSPHSNEQPLTPALSPYEGERENRSPVLEQSIAWKVCRQNKRVQRGGRGLSS